MTDAVLIVTGGKLQTPTVVVAEELGLHVILTDRDPDCCCAERADEFYPIDIYDVKAHVKLAMDLQRRSDINLRGVFTAAADPVKTVAQAAACAALPHAPLSAVDAANRKDVMRETLSFFGGVQQPRWLKREAGQSLGHTILQVGLPAIVKNIKGAGGRGHTLFRSEADLTDDKLTLALRRAVSLSR